MPVMAWGMTAAIQATIMNEATAIACLAVGSILKGANHRMSGKTIEARRPTTLREECQDAAELLAPLGDSTELAIRLGPGFTSGQDQIPPRCSFLASLQSTATRGNGSSCHLHWLELFDFALGYTLGAHFASTSILGRARIICCSQCFPE